MVLVVLYPHLVFKLAVLALAAMALRLLMLHGGQQKNALILCLGATADHHGLLPLVEEALMQLTLLLEHGDVIALLARVH